MIELTGRLGLEAAQREALVILFENLNDKIDEMESDWEAEDEELMNSLNRGQPAFTIEKIEENNFYPGTIPSLISASIDKYPNVCVICYRGVPKRSFDDTAENYTDTLAVEIMVKSGPFDGENLTEALFYEQEVNSRIQKTIDAAHLTLLNNRSLNNTIIELPAPRVAIGDIFVRREEQGVGSKWLWQGGSLEYDMDKYVNFY